MSERSIRAEYTRGSIGATMMKTALAMLAGTLAMSGYNIADTYFVGKLGGAEPLAAMGFTFPIVMLVGCIFNGTGTGIIATVAHALGGDNQDLARNLTSAGLFLVACAALVMGCLGVLTADKVFGLMGAKGETLRLVRSYMDVWFYGCVTAGISMVGNKVLITAGRPKTASAMTIFGMVLNVVLDPLLIFGVGIFPRLGIQGAAIATVISQMASAGLILIVLTRLGLLRWQAMPYTKLFAAWRNIVRYALPAIFGMLLFPLGTFVITRITAEFGVQAVAAVSAASRLEMVAFVFPMSLGIGLMPMIAQNFGARLYSRVRQCLKFSIAVAIFFLSLAAVLFFVLARPLSAIFTPDPDVQSVMVLWLRIVPVCFCFLEIQRFSGFALIGCGHPNLDASIKALRMLGLMVPLSLLALWADSLTGLFWARAVTDILAGAVAWFIAWKIVSRLPADGEDISRPGHATNS
ncbi:MAG: MATE family efflux transporter [Lentisphaerae bacterium]|nr:MATE family efflux transporter [Lentisphaerota bacterium]OQC17883.1 MAG: Multidrug export protein MepA [Lentisphaerae bacterium ADurb.Bin082]